MLSMRTLARAAPRTAQRCCSAPTIRAASTFRQLPSSATGRLTGSFAARCASPLRPSTNSLAAAHDLTKAFSTAAPRRAAQPSAGETDDELVAKIESEIQYETEVEEVDQVPASVKDFLDNGPFEVVDVPGKEEVKLVRTYGNEKITITFSIADLANYEPDPLYDEDMDGSEETGLDEELDEADLLSSSAQRGGQKGGDLNSSGKSSKSTSSGRKAAELEEEDLEDEAAAEEEETEEDEDDGPEAPVPVRLTIVVEKPGSPGAGALAVEAVVQDGAVVVESLHRYADAADAHEGGGPALSKDGVTYPGPPFGSLDEDLQMLVERYLEERGVTQALAVFVPDYVDMKEQKEYVAWLGGVKGFLEA